MKKNISTSAHQHINILAYCYIVFIFLFSSCSDFLEETPQTALSTEQVFADKNNIQPYLDGVYFKWKTTRVNRKAYFTLLGTDEIQQGEYQVSTDAPQAGLDKYDGFYEPASNVIAETWNVRWPVVTLSSQALSVLKEMEASASEEELPEIKLYVGQASFYRASVLFELARYWGEVPVAEINGTHVKLTGRKPLDVVYKMIVEDLQTAASDGYLPSTPSATNVRIPTVWAAKAMLAKVYMSAQEESGYRDIAKAKTLLQEIKDLGGFRLINNYANLWTGTSDVTAEVIYSFAFNNIWPDTNELQWYAGSRAVSSDPNCYIGGYDLALPTEHCYKDAGAGGIWEPGDLRKEESIRYNFTYNNKTAQAVSGFGTDQLLPHIKKFEDKRIDGIQQFYDSGKDFYVIRYSDVLLLLAECLNEEGQTADAVNIVNDEVRKRAWGGTLPDAYKWSASMSKDEFKVKILDERLRELCFEGWRRMDLLRTGNFVNYIKQNNRWAKESQTIKEHHQRFPIPLVEIKQNEFISETDQNTGYN
jgi:hypothetical protein